MLYQQLPNKYLEIYEKRIKVSFDSNDYYRASTHTTRKPQIPTWKKILFLVRVVGILTQKKYRKWSQINVRNSHKT